MMKNILTEYFLALNQLQISIFSFYIHPSSLEQDERKSREKIVRVMRSLRKQLPQNTSLLNTFEKGYEIFFSLNTLKLRVPDPSTFEVCQDEMKKMMQNLRTILLGLASKKNAEYITLSIHQFTQSIERFDELYRSVLQVVSSDPKVFLFFLQTLFAARDFLTSIHLVLKNENIIFQKISIANKTSAFFRSEKEFFRFFADKKIIMGLFFAVIINHFYSFSPCLLPLTTIYVMQTSIGNFFYQGIRKFLVVFFIVSMASFTIFSMHFFYHAMHDVILGAVIGIAINSLVFPRRGDVAFRKAIVPLIQDYQSYFIAVIDQLLTNGRSPPDNGVLEYDLLHLPNWVYEKGFNSGLKKGYEFFLLTLEKMSQLLFIMHYLVRYSFDKELLAKIRLPLLQCTDSINQLFLFLITILELKNPIKKISDLSEEIQALEQQFYTIIPSSLELLDIKQEYVYLAEFIYCLNELCQLLLKLAATFQHAAIFQNSPLSNSSEND